MISDDGFREECGVFGVYGHPNAARLTALGLHALQHRGQQGAGVAVSHGGALVCHRGLGLVGDVFSEGVVEKLPGRLAVGHVRYGTAGDDSLLNVQPICVRIQGGQLAVAHNGNLVNARKLRVELESRGSIFSTTTDTEVILHLVAGSRRGTFVNRLVDALYAIQGAYSLALATTDTLVAVRDPHGFRPLVLGELDGAWIVSSETCALDVVGARYVREVEPGELVIIDADGMQALRPFPPRPRRACIFEHIYFARPDSTVFGLSVYDTRRRLGRLLAAEHPVEADVVVPVPDSGTAGALGFAEQCAVPFQMGLLRSHYVGRTFITPGQHARELKVRLKLAPVRSVLEGRRVVLVDDSIVRGTTSRDIVRMVREAGAAEVHLRITAPPTTGSCFYGVDTPTREELIAHRMDVEGIRRFLDVDSLGYASLAALRDVQGDARGGFCEACFSGEYPVAPEPDEQEAQVSLFLGG